MSVHALLALHLVVAAPKIGLPPTRAEVEPNRFLLRTGSFGLGVSWRPFLSPTFSCGYPSCGVSPTIGFDFELGSRKARLLLGSWHAPIPYVPNDGDLVSLDAAMFEIGGLFGNENIRGGIVLEGGAINGGAAAVLRVSPWVDRRGHRHGIEFRVNTTIWYWLGITVGYRFHPRSLEWILREKDDPRQRQRKNSSRRTR